MVPGVLSIPSHLIPATALQRRDWLYPPTVDKGTQVLRRKLITQQETVELGAPSEQLLAWRFVSSFRILLDSWLIYLRTDYLILGCGAE